MSTPLTSSRTTLEAPSDGRVRFLPPRALAGELEVYSTGEPLAEIKTGEGSVFVTAPGTGFILGHLVPEDESVRVGQPLVEYREAT